MYETRRRGERRHRTVSRQVASEDAACYTAAAPSAVGGRVAGEAGVAEAVDQLAAAVDVLAGVGWLWRPTRRCWTPRWFCRPRTR
ncbi:MAG: hypothetical protein ACR2KP_18325 [Egibacteraceae bacterium]